MNLLSFLIPKSEVHTLNGGDTLRMAVHKMSHHHYQLISTGDILFYLQENDMTLKEMEHVAIESVPVYRPLMALPVSASDEDIGKVLTNQNYVPLVDERGIFIGIITRKRYVEALGKAK